MASSALILVDSWAWIALADRSDPYHRVAKSAHKQLRRSRRRYVTSDFILNEVITFLYSAAPVSHAQGYLSSLFAEIDAGTYSLVHVSPDQFRRAWQMRQQYHDKPDISFVDFTSMVVMLDLGLADVFTGDDHFRQVNLSFQLVP